MAPSSNGVQVALHDLGGTGVPLLMSHATGFHGRCWQPVADLLTDRFRCWALDFRGHGETPAPHDWSVDWERYADDASAAARAVRTDEPILGVGHSMGGACLIMAAHREPSLFAGLVVFEPIIFPTSTPRTADNPLAAGARRRRSSFPSVEAAIANYTSKPPMSAFTTAALRAYVEHGFRRGDDGEIHLRCTPEHEARTFEAGTNHETWSVLGEVQTPTWVVAGRDDGTGPPSVAPGIAERLARGRFVEQPDLDHFGPMTHPDRLAELVREMADELGR